jgi:biopolymer transport protein ExbB/TolQ
MNSGFKVGEMIVNGWPVLTVLLIMSILSLTVIVDRIVAFSRAKTNNSGFAARILEVIAKQGPGAALDLCRKSSRPIAVVIGDVLSRADADRAAMERAAQHALQAQINELEMYVPILGTVASTAPFVGLFGTVIGIIRAFHDIASNAGGGPEVVSAGIAEALITTAVGLFVAIPATMAYNYFVRHVQTVMQDIDLASYDVVEKLSERGRK